MFLVATLAEFRLNWHNVVSNKIAVTSYLSQILVKLAQRYTIVDS